MNEKLVIHLYFYIILHCGGTYVDHGSETKLLQQIYQALHITETFLKGVRCGQLRPMACFTKSRPFYSVAYIHN